MLESSEKVGFYYDGSSFIVGNSKNAHMWSVEDIFTDKTEPIIYKVVATIGRKDSITKGFGTVRWSWTDDEVKCTQRNWIMYSNFQTHQSTY